MRIISLFVATWMAALFFSVDASAEERRVALVIGNSAYRNVPELLNPANDASDIAAALRRLGFDVTLGLDLDAASMRREISSFQDTSRTADLSLVYYAGHGIEVDQTNYLIPIDASLSNAEVLSDQTIPLNLIVSALAESSGVKVIIVDACRQNPFADILTSAEGTRSVGVGLVRVDPVGGVQAGGILIGYAAREGTVAYDGTGRNSPYAQALLQHIEVPGLEISKLFRRVRDLVFELTGGMQEPFTYGALPGTDIFLAGTSSTASPPEQSPIPWLELDARSVTENIEPLLTEAQRRDVQRALRFLGADPGSIDGQFGPATRRAITAARARLGLPVGDTVTMQLLKGLPDAPGIDALRSPVARSFKGERLPSSIEARLKRALEAFEQDDLLFDYFDGRLYVAVRSNGGRIDWHTANGLSTRSGGHLVTITSAEEARFVSRMISQDAELFGKATYGDGLRGPFIGLWRTDAGLPWNWITGEPVDYTDWFPGQPDDNSGWENVAAFHISSERTAGILPRWDDVAGVARGFVVEFE